MTIIDDPIPRVRSQRNCAVATAIFLVVGAVAAVLPGLVKRGRQWRAATERLVELQMEISGIQRDTRVAEAETIQAQEEIRRLLSQAH